MMPVQGSVWFNRVLKSTDDRSIIVDLDVIGAP